MEETPQFNVDTVKATARSAAASLKSAGDLIAKQAERTKIVTITLPRAYAELGKVRLKELAGGEDFKQLTQRVSELLAERKKIHDEVQSRSAGNTMAEKAKKAVTDAAALATIKAIDLKAYQSLAELGQAIYEKYGANAGPVQLIEPIATATARLQQLNQGLAKINEEAKGRWFTPMRIALGGGSLIVCLLIGSVIAGRGASKGALAPSEPRGGDTPATVSSVTPSKSSSAVAPSPNGDGEIIAPQPNPAGRVENVRASYAKYAQARAKMLEMSQENPRVRIVGEIRQREGDALYIWGNALPVDGNNRGKGVSYDEANLIVMNPDPGEIVQQRFYRGGVHCYLKSSSGEGLLGAKVPVMIYGGTPEHLVSQAAAVDAAYDAYVKSRQSEVRNVMAQANQDDAIGLSGESGASRAASSGVNSVEGFRGIEIGDPRDKVDSFKGATVAEADGLYYYIFPSDGVIVIASHYRVVGITYVLRQELLSRYFPLIKTFGITNVSSKQLPFERKWSNGSLSTESAGAGSSRIHDNPELLNAYQHVSPPGPEQLDSHTLCVTDGENSYPLAVTAFNTLIAPLKWSQIPFAAENSGTDPFLDVVPQSSLKIARRSAPLPAVDYDAFHRFASPQSNGAVVCDIAFSDNGRLLAAAEMEGVVRIWHARSGAEVAVLRGHKGAVNAVAHAKTAKVLASAGDDGVIRVWDMVARKLRHELRGHGGAVHDVAVSGDGHYAVSVGEDKRIRVWNLQTGASLRSSEPCDEANVLVALSDSGKSVATAGRDGTVRVWDFEALKQQSSFDGHRSTVRAVAFADSAETVLSGDDDGVVMLWNANDGKLVRFFRGNDGGINRSRSNNASIDPVSSICSTKGRVAVLHTDGIVCLWNVSAPIQTGLVKLGGKLGNFERAVRSAVAITEDGRELATAFGGAEIDVRFLAPLISTSSQQHIEAIARFEVSARPVNNDTMFLKFTENDEHLLWDYAQPYARRGSVFRGGISSGLQEKVLQLPAHKRLGFSANAHYAVLADANSSARMLFDLTSKREIANWKPRENQGWGAVIEGAGFLRGGEKEAFYVDTVNGDPPRRCDVVTVSLPDGKEVRRYSLLDDAGAVPAKKEIAGSRIFCTSADGQVVVRDMETGNVLRTKSRSDIVSCSQDGRLAVVRDAEGSVYVWDVDKDERGAALPPALSSERWSEILFLRWTKDSRFLFFWQKSRGAVSFAIEVKTGRSVGKLPSDQSFSPLAYCAEKRWLAGGKPPRVGASRRELPTLILWDCDKEREISEASMLSEYEGSGSLNWELMSTDAVVAISHRGREVAAIRNSDYSENMIQVWRLP